MAVAPRARTTSKNEVVKVRPRRPRSMRDLEVLERLLTEYGDITLSEAIEKQFEVSRGRPVEWDLGMLCGLHTRVETIMAINRMTITAACRAFAREINLKPKLVEKRYRQTMPSLRERFPGHSDDTLRWYALTHATSFPVSTRQIMSRRLFE